MAIVPAGNLPDATTKGAHLSGPILFHLASQAKFVQSLLPTACVTSIMTITHAGKLPDAAASWGPVPGAAPVPQRAQQGVHGVWYSPAAALPGHHLHDLGSLCQQGVH